jgi:transcriptional regulator
MYTPATYRVTDQATIEAFIREHNFATLISYDGTSPIATHIPLELERRGHSLYLQGHLAKANPQWKTFQSDSSVLAIFVGPHTYVSPRWYNHVNVPTWNYMAAHVYGKPRIVNDRHELSALLKKLVDRYEARAANPPYQIETLSKEFLEKEMNGIVGFEISVERIEASFKLSQNRSEQDYDNVIAELEKRDNPQSQAIAKAMREHRPHWHK